MFYLYVLCNYTLVAFSNHTSCASCMRSSLTDLGQFQTGAAGSERFINRTLSQNSVT